MISVIIPVYNTEKYLPRSIRSVLDSGYPDFELILVNDGSADGSLAVCRDFAAKDSRVQVIDQENQGVSAARNRGLEACRGEWVVFVDSDDYISPDFLRLVAKEEHKKWDLLIFDQQPAQKKAAAPGGTASYHGGMTEIVKKMLTFSPLVPGRNAALPSPCGKAYKREIIFRNELRFPVGVKIGEDQIFNIAYLLSIDGCVYLQRPVYFTEARLDSATHVCHPDFLEDSCRFERRLKALLEERGGFPLLETPYYTHALADMSYVLVRGIFSPYSPRSYRENCGLCRRMEEDPIFRRAMEYNRVNRRPLIRMLLFFFRLRWYWAVNIICRMGYVYLYRIKGM